MSAFSTNDELENDAAGAGSSSAKVPKDLLSPGSATSFWPCCHSPMAVLISPVHVWSVGLSTN